MVDWVTEHSGLIMPLLVLGAGLTYVLILGVPALRNRVLRRLPCVATHAVQVAVDLSDESAVDRAMRQLHDLASHARWSPAPPSYHVRTTAALTEDGVLRWQETVVTATTYHLRRNRRSAESGLTAYLDSLVEHLGHPDPAPTNSLRNGGEAVEVVKTLP
jgi:hypothetical protein